MRICRIGQHRVGALQPVLGEVHGELLSGLLEQTLEVAPRLAEPAGEAVDVEAWITVTPGNFSKRRPQPGGLQSAPGDELPGLSARADCGCHKVEQMQLDEPAQFSG